MIYHRREASLRHFSEISDTRAPKSESRTASLGKRQSVTLGISSTLGARVVSLALGTLFSVIFTRILGPEGRGVYAVFTAGATLGVSLSALGFPTANAYFSARDERNIPTLFGNSLALTALFTVVIVALLALWPEFQGVLGVEPAYYHIGLWFFAIGLPLNFLSALLRDLLLGKQWFVQYNLATAVSVLGYGALGVLLVVVLPSKVMAILLANALTPVIPLLLALWFLLPFERWHFSWDMLKKSAFIGWRVYLFNLLAIALARLNVFMISRWLGSKQAGLYSTALMLAELTANLPNAAAPVIFTLTAVNQLSGTRLVLKTNRLVFLLVLAGNLGLAVLCVPLLSVFGPEFPKARYALWVLLPGIQCFSVVAALRSYFQGLGFPLPTLLVPLAGLGLSFSLNLWLIPGVGIAGASLALVSSYAVMMLLSVWYVRTRNPTITWSEFFFPAPAEIMGYLTSVVNWSKRLRSREV